MSAYLDTSLVVTALTNERRTADVQGWIGRQKPGSLSISDWVVAEFSAALSMKQRVGTLGAAERAATLHKFREFISTGTEVAIVGSSLFRAAAAFADRYDLGLRAGDALHLAIASEHGKVLHTLDKKLAAAGLALGVATVLL